MVYNYFNRIKTQSKLKNNTKFSDYIYDNKENQTWLRFQVEYSTYNNYKRHILHPRFGFI